MLISACVFTQHFLGDMKYVSEIQYMFILPLIYYWNTVGQVSEQVMFPFSYPVSRHPISVEAVISLGLDVPLSVATQPSHTLTQHAQRTFVGLVFPWKDTKLYKKMFCCCCCVCTHAHMRIIIIF